MNGRLEIEAKMAVAEHDSWRDRLRAAGAIYVGKVLETNRFFDRADQSLRRGGCGLRLRSTQPLDGPARPATITFKGPQQPGELKVRPECEVAVNDAAAGADLLRQLGFGEQISFEKRRETWTLDGCEVELDELPRIGRFVEIEGESAEAIEAVRRKLGLDGAPLVRASYLALLVANGGAGHFGF